MFKKAVVWLTLLALINLMAGCMHTVKKQQEEIFTPVEKITLLTMKSGETVSFNDEGGKYINVSTSSTGGTLSITGNTAAGEVIVKPLAEIRTIETVESRGDSSWVNQLTPQQFMARYESEQSRQYIRQIVKAILVDGSTVSFPRGGAHYVSELQALRGMNEYGDVVNIPIDHISYVLVKQVDVLLTLLTVAVVAAIVVGAVVILADDDEGPSPPPETTQSCPLVYSWNGDCYVLDAEPLGGATNHALARTDLTQLEHAKSVDGEYRVLIRNEMKEIQYLDEMSLVLVQKEVDGVVAPDESGRLHLCSNTEAPVAAYDENGRSVKDLLAVRDSIAWQTTMSQTGDVSADNCRHRITAKFVRPHGAEKAWLVYTAGTSSWGSYMVRDMLEARGDAVDAWYEGIEKGGLPLLEMLSFLDREELFWMKIRLDRNGELLNRGLILGGGPLVKETRVVSLDISDIPGDTLTIRLDPPAGFWSIDCLAIDYSEPAFPHTTEVLLSEALDQDGVDVSAGLLKNDSVYYEMDDTGDWFEARFEVPDSVLLSPQVAVLKTAGYYRLILDKSHPEDTDVIRYVQTTPGAIVERAVAEFAKWSDSLNVLVK